jgi:hypothetical protein
MKSTQSLVILGLVSLLYVVLSLQTSKVHLSYPESGITCIQTETVFTSQPVPAGCFTGDVHGHNELNKEATLKYQSNTKVVGSVVMSVSQ